MLNINFTTILFQFINFIILAVALYFLMFKKIFSRVQQRKEELEEYLEDLKKIREFMQLVVGMLGEADRFTTSADPYGGRNRPYKGNISGNITRMKTDLALAKPNLAVSGFDLSGIESAFTAYLDKQQLLGTFQQGNQTGTGIYTSSGDFHYTRGPSRFGGGKAKRVELTHLAAAQLARDLFSKQLVATNQQIVIEKKGVLRDRVDKYQVQSDLVSEAKTAKQSLDYKPMAISDIGSVQTALLDLVRGQRGKLDFPFLEDLRIKYQGLASKYFNMLPKFATGGFVDSILARLSPGEFVLRPEAVRQLGVPFLNALNSFKYPVPAFATGGLVENVPVGSPQGARSVSGSQVPTVTINGDFYRGDRTDWTNNC